MQQHCAEGQIPHEEQILEAIDQLRRRKARPDSERICNYLLRKFSVDAYDTIKNLHRLIEAEKVIQVDYKGNTSYRNASKWSRLQLYKNRPEGFVKEKLNSSMVAGAFAELVVEEPDYLDQGVPAYRLVEQLLDGISNPTSRRMVEDFLSKEVASGNITKLTNGHYSLVSSSDMMSTTATTTSAITNTVIATTTIVSSPINSSLVLASPQHQENTISISNNNNNNIVSINNNNINDLETIEQQIQPEIRETTNSPNRFNPSPVKLSSFDRSSPPPTTITTDRNNKSPEPRSLYDFYDEEVMVTDSRSNTPRSSLQASPQSHDNASVEKTHKEECYDITIIGKEPDSPEESVTKENRKSREEDTIVSTNDSRKDDRKISDNHYSNLKRSSKAERKQRLLVRAEDPMDIEIKFENFHRDNKDDRDKQQRELELEHHSDDRDDDDNGRSSTNPSPTPSNTTVGAFRSARRKRAKKVFDPSENNVVKRRRGRPVSQPKAPVGVQEPQESTKSVVKEGPNRRCSLCAKDKTESLVACRDCTVRAHPTCIYPPDELLQKSGCSWQCERCKSCTVCCETSDIGPLITCNNCDEAYHYSCHVPRVSKANSKWQCNDCSQKNFKSNSNISAIRPESPVNPPVLSPQVSPGRASSEQMDDDMGSNDGMDPNIPDASDWTSEQVYQYFARLFPKEAEVFRVQAIDGHSLLLMKRSDVLNGLDLLLGPALKIYRHVLKLQMRRDDTQLYWL